MGDAEKNLDDLARKNAQLTEDLSKQKREGDKA